jgi:hypothetical protein
MHPVEAKAEKVAATLTAMANPKRLIVMCTLLGVKSRLVIWPRSFS